MNTVNGNSFSFSLSLSTQPKKEKLSTSIFGTKIDNTEEKKVFFTEVVENQIIGSEDVNQELIIPVKAPSWIQKSKERIANETKQQEAKATVSKVSDGLDEARISLLKEVTGEDQHDDTKEDLVIPLNDKAKQEGDPKYTPVIIQNRMPGFDTMQKEDYFQKELESLPESCDSDAYSKVPIHAFGRAILRGMGWDGISDVDPSVFEIKPRPDRLGLGAISLVIDKNKRKSAVKKSKSDLEMEKAYSGVKKASTDPYAYRSGVQVGVITGPKIGKTGMIVQNVSTTDQMVKVRLEGEVEMRVFRKVELRLLNDLTAIKSFFVEYGVTERGRERRVGEEKREEEREERREREREEKREKSERSRSRSRELSHRHRHRHRHSRQEDKQHHHH